MTEIPANATINTTSWKSLYAERNIIHTGVFDNISGSTVELVVVNGRKFSDYSWVATSRQLSLHSSNTSVCGHIHSCVPGRDHNCVQRVTLPEPPPGSVGRIRFGCVSTVPLLAGKR